MVPNAIKANVGGSGTEVGVPMTVKFIALNTLNSLAGAYEDTAEPREIKDTPSETPGSSMTVGFNAGNQPTTVPLVSLISGPIVRKYVPGAKLKPENHVTKA